MTEDRLDVCVCGDYRHQHDERGRCKLNGLGHGGAEDCHKFTLFLTAREVLILRSHIQDCALTSHQSQEPK